MKRTEKADSAVQSALNMASYNVKISYTNLKPQINKFFDTKWQQCWNDNINIKFFLIKPTLEDFDLPLERNKILKKQRHKRFWCLCIYVTAKKPNFSERFRKESEYAETAI